MSDLDNQLHILAGLILADAEHCVLCTYPLCHKAKWCSKPGYEKYRIKLAKVEGK